MILERKSKFSLSSQAGCGKINHHLREKVIILGIKDFFKLTSDEQYGMPSDHLEGVTKYQYNDYIGLFIDRKNEYLELEDHKKEKIILPFTQIEQVNFIPWEKTIVKALNPLAEGIVGGLIGGDAMAVVSAIDAKGRTRSENVKVEGAVEIRYHPKGDFRTIKVMVFRSHLTRNDTFKWAKTLSKYAGLPEPQYITPQPKGPTYL